jgi:hypothetical protein
MNSKTSMWQAIAIVSLIIAVVALIMPFVIPAPEGPEGPEGPRGLTGDDGDDGQDGDDGATGAQGPQGATGAQGPQGLAGNDGTNGTACWDLNDNGIGDLPAEDTNGDIVVDVNDCIGPAGAGVLVEFDIMSANVPLTGTCQQMTGAEIWINVPGAGNVTFIANVDLNMVHVMGTEDSWRFVLDNTPADCLAGEWNTDGSIPSSWDSGPVEVHDTAERVHVVGLRGRGRVGQCEHSCGVLSVVMASEH